MASFLSKIFGDPQNKIIHSLGQKVQEINALEMDLTLLKDEEFPQKTAELKERIKNGETLDGILVEAFALCREASKRTLKQRHFDVQLMGGMILHQGKIAEMKTGEGKTLSATLPAYLNALLGKGVHIVTVNDYLSQRDAVWMGQIYNLLGLTVGCITHDASYIYKDEQVQSSKFKVQSEDEKLKEKDKERDTEGGSKVVMDFLRPCERKDAYLADITYGTNNEFGFDYLRDNLMMEKSQQVQRGFNSAIVDEIDSILIDEARTPLIISQPDMESSKRYQDFARLIPRLKAEEHFTSEEKSKTVFLTEKGIDQIEHMLGVSDIYTDKGITYLHHLEQALRAQVFFQKDRDYIVKDGKVVIIDEFTGRLMPGRRYSGGLHQAIEAKEGVKVEAESKTMASITFQNYFRFYEKLSGMTGTALTSAEEFEKVYKLQVVSIPTNKPMQRTDFSDKVYKTESGKFKAVVQEIKIRNQKGQPILVGTRSVERNEYLSKLLSREGIKHEVLNAKNHAREGLIIAQAGKLGSVTVATNMAGRGVDIMLGGTPPSNLKSQMSNAEGPEQWRRVKTGEENLYKEWEEEHQGVVELGGLYVVGTERHEARRIDDQLRGRSGRQGDPGETQFFVSLEDELLRIFGSDRIKSLMGFLKIPEDQPIEAKILSSALEKAQEKVEGLHFDLRKHLLEYDDVLSLQRKKIYSQRDKILAMQEEDIIKYAEEILVKELEEIVFANSVEKVNLGEILEQSRVILPMSQDFLVKVKEFKNEQEIADFFTQYSQGLLREKVKQKGIDNIVKVFTFVLLKTLDSLWTEHLEQMEHLRDTVSLRSYGGKDPLVEYKTESKKMFNQIQESFSFQVARIFFKID